MDRIEELLQTPYWIIDILPMQVPKDSHGQYFAIEKYLLSSQHQEIKKKHINVILKMNCYRDVTIDGELNPTPDSIAAVMNEQYVHIIVGDSMILSEPDETYLTLFNPNEALLDFIKAIASAEWLFVWKP